MDFNICKCAILPITKKHNTTFGNILENVDDHKYPSVSILHVLCWKKHCNKITKKVNKTLGLLRRTLSPCSNVKRRAYQTLVQQKIEYAAEAWNTYNITTADHLEHIQRAATHFVHNDNRRTTSINNII